MDKVDFNSSDEYLSPAPMNPSEYEDVTNRTATEKSIIWAAFTVMTIFGSVINTVMIIILLRMKSSFFTVIITGLCFSDLISAVNSPLYVYAHLNKFDFKLPMPFCFIWLPLDTATSYITTNHVFMLSLIRFVSITNINGSSIDITPKICRILAVTSYVTIFSVHVAFNISIMEWQNNDDSNYCGVVKRVSGWYVMTLMLWQLLGMAIPSILIVVFCFALIIRLVHRHLHGISSSASSRRKEKQALIQLAGIVIIYVIGYSAEFAIKTYLTVKEFALPEHVLSSLALTAHGIMRVCECVNPLIYYLASSDVKQECGRLIADTRRAATHCLRSTKQVICKTTVSDEIQVMAAQPPSRQQQQVHERNSESVVTGMPDSLSPEVALNTSEVVVSAKPDESSTNGISPVISTPGNAIAGGGSSYISISVDSDGVNSETRVVPQDVTVGLPHSVQDDGVSHRRHSV